MSFNGYKDVIEEGDTAILYVSASSMYAIEVVSNIPNKHGEIVENVFQTTYGALRVKNLIGTRFGCKVELTRGWAYVLHPTCELWTLTLPHRTQIIYTPDASAILMGLELHPGSIVIEAGTGSGSLSHALARCIAPSGHLHTFDFHEVRAQTAKEEFIRHGLGEIVSAGHRDVCADGFGVDLNGKADAVFLDLPHPWLAVSHAILALKDTGGRFCSFSPCIEQVQRTCEALAKEGFVEISTMENLQRELNVVTRAIPTLDVIDAVDKKAADSKFNFLSSSYNGTSTGHTGYLTMATWPPSWFRAVSQGDGDDLEDETNNRNSDQLNDDVVMNNE